MEKLAQPDRAASYLNTALQDSAESFLIALGKVAQANGLPEMAVAAEAATLASLSSILKAGGLKIEIAKEGTKSELPTPVPIDDSFPVGIPLQEEPVTSSGPRR